MPYRHIDEQEDKKDELDDKYVIFYEHIMGQLLKSGVASYYDKKAEPQMIALDDIRNDYAEELESGIEISVVLDMEVERIVNEFFGE